MQGFWCDTNASDSHMFMDATWHATAARCSVVQARVVVVHQLQCLVQHKMQLRLNTRTQQISHNRSQHRPAMLGGCSPASRMPAGRGRERRCGRAARKSRPPLSDGSRSAHSPKHPLRTRGLGCQRARGLEATLRLSALRPPEGSRTRAVTNFRKSLRAPVTRTNVGHSTAGQGMRAARRTAVHRDDFAHQPLVRLIRRCTNHPLSDGTAGLEDTSAMVAAHRCIPRPG